MLQSCVIDAMQVLTPKHRMKTVLYSLVRAMKFELAVPADDIIGKVK